MSFFELRQYPTYPGKMDDWVTFMEDTIIPFQVAQGMVITGSFRCDDDLTYVWTRRFETEQEHTALYDKVYKSDTWIQTISPRIPSMIDRSGIKVLRLIATPKSATH